MDNSPFSQGELKQYSQCPEVTFVGSHTAGFTNCFFCCEIYRRYRRKEGTNPVAQVQQKRKQQKERDQETTVSVQDQKDDNDDEGCGKIQCMRAGWCMCD